MLQVVVALAILAFFVFVVGPLTATVLVAILKDTLLHAAPLPTAR